MNKEYILKIAKDKEIVSEVISFCEKNNIESAWISAIGAVKSAEIAYFDYQDKRYQTNTFEKYLEIASLSGNLGKLKAQTVAHLHIVLSDRNFNTIGGHLNSAVVSATCEVLISTLNQPIIRKKDEETGLNLIDQ